jgi:hypothetical protein
MREGEGGKGGKREKKVGERERERARSQGRKERREIGRKG